MPAGAANRFAIRLILALCTLGDSAHCGERLRASAQHEETRFFMFRTRELLKKAYVSKLTYQNFCEAANI